MAMIRNIIIFALALIALVTLALGINSYRQVVTHRFLFAPHRTGWITIGEGRIEIMYNYFSAKTTKKTDYSRHTVPIDGSRRDFKGLWAFHISGETSPMGSFKLIWVPIWVPLLAFALYPIVALARGPLRKVRRRRRGLCVKCGYNLAGNPTGTCPECGTKFAEVANEPPRRCEGM